MCFRVCFTTIARTLLIRTLCFMSRTTVTLCTTLLLTLLSLDKHYRLMATEGPVSPSSLINCTCVTAEQTIEQVALLSQRGCATLRICQ